MVVEESEVIASHGRVASRPRRAAMGAYASLWLDTQPRRLSAWSFILVLLWLINNPIIENQTLFNAFNWGRSDLCLQIC